MDRAEPKSQPADQQVAAGDEAEAAALEKFRQGLLTLEEIEGLLDKGVI
jgi:hypothetical protein